MIKVKECGEPLVDIKKLCPDLVIAPNLKKENRAFLRKTTVKMVCQAKKHLPEGMTFIIESAWRPQYLQEKIFQQFVKRFTKKYPLWPKSKVIKEVEKYVAPFEGGHVSGHMAGGAVDLRIWKNGRKIPMKSSKLTYQENAKSFQPKLPLYIQKNRQTMFDALQKAGLSNFPKEFWHWSYGDIWWAKRNKEKIAIYDVVKRSNSISKKLKS